MIKKLNSLAEKLKVLGHPTRLEILSLLLHSVEPQAAGSFVEATGQTQSVISQHLHWLKKEELVKVKVDGTKRLYSIVDVELPFITYLLNV